MSVDFQVISAEGEEHIVSYIDGHGLKSVRNDHPNYGIVRGLLDLTPEELEEYGNDYIAGLFDPAEAISKRFEELTDRVTVRNGTIFFDGDPMNNSLTDYIVRLMEEDEDFWPFVLFLDHLMQNPVEHSISQAFDWIRAAGDGLSITDNGFVVGFKGCTSDDKGGYQSTRAGHAIVNGEEFNGHIPYAVGDEVTMPRSEVAHDPGQSCSTGLHVGTRSYATSYASGGVLMEVWVNPRDIVSVPNREHEKMRVCKFYIAGTVEAEDKYGALRNRRDVYVAPTESPYDEDEYGDGEEFDGEDEVSDFLDTDEEPNEDFGDTEGDDEDEAETPGFVGRTARNPTDAEWDEMVERAKRRHRGSPGFASFTTYVSTTGGWHLQIGTNGAQKNHWLVSE